MPTSSQALHRLRAGDSTHNTTPCFDPDWLRLDLLQAAGGMDEASYALLQRPNLPALGSVHSHNDQVISALAKANKQRSASVQLFKGKHRLANNVAKSFSYCSMTPATDSDSMGQVCNLFSDFQLSKRIKAPDISALGESPRQPSYQVPQTHTEIIEATDNPSALHYPPVLLSDSVHTWPVPPPIETGVNQGNKSIATACKYEIAPSAVVHKPHLRSSYGNGRLKQAIPQNHHQPRSVTRCAGGDGSTLAQVRLVDHTQSSLGRYGADGAQSMEKDVNGACGVLTFNTKKGRHEWTLVNTLSSSKMGTLTGNRRKPSRRRVKYALPSGLWVSPYELMERQQKEKENSRQRSLPSILDFSLRFGKGVQVTGLLDVCGRQLDLPGASSSPVLHPAEQVAQIPGVEVHIPPLGFPSHREWCSWNCADSQTDGTGTGSCPDSETSGHERQCLLTTPTTSWGADVKKKPDIKQDQESEQGKTSAADNEILASYGQNKRRIHETVDNSCDKVTARNLKESKIVESWEQDKEAAVGNSEGLGVSEQVITDTCGGNIACQSNHQGNMRDAGIAIHGSFSPCRRRETDRLEASQSSLDKRSRPTHLGVADQESLDLPNLSRPHSSSCCGEESIDKFYNIIRGASSGACGPTLGKTQTFKGNPGTNTSGNASRQVSCPVPREGDVSTTGIGKIGSLVIPPPYPKSGAKKIPADYPSSDESPPIDELSMKSSNGTRLLRRYNPPVLRMRTKLPPPDPSKLCFKSNIPGCTHAEILQCLESKFPDIEVTSLQYDPIHLQDYRDPLNFGQRFKCMWLFTLTPESDASQLLLRGFRLRGQRMNIRRADDVYAEEKRSFSLCCEMLSRGLVVEGIDQQGLNRSFHNNNVYRKAERKPARGSKRSKVRKLSSPAAVKAVLPLKKRS